MYFAVGINIGLPHHGNENTVAVGFDHNTYTSLGTRDKKITFTSKADIGRALAELSILVLTPAISARVPDQIRISGSAISFTDARDIVQRVRREFGNISEVSLKGVDLETTRKGVQESLANNSNFSPQAIPLLHLTLNEGQIDFSDNDNELVNPNQSVWKWKTVEDLTRERKGFA
ncbi:hypothetical protein BKA93DRAFT_803954 [Sparassis latifolia]